MKFKNRQYTTDSVIFNTTCMSWLSAFRPIFGATLSNSVRVITTEFCTPALMLDIIEKYKITYFLLSPTSLALILQTLTTAKQTTDLSSLKLVVTGGSSLFIELVQWFRRVFPPTTKLFIVYGISEAAGPVAMNMADTNVEKCVGYLSTNSCVKIVNDNDHQRCGINEIGEIRYKMMFPFLGYYGEDQLTRDTFDEDGFIRSGDIGYFDEMGKLYLIDRKKEMIIYDCNHVSPVEIESVIMTHCGVLEVCIIGKPDLTYAELPTAVVVRKPGANVTEKEIEDLVKGKEFLCFYINTC